MQMERVFKELNNEPHAIFRFYPRHSRSVQNAMVSIDMNLVKHANVVDRNNELRDTVLRR